MLLIKIIQRAQGCEQRRHCRQWQSTAALKTSLINATYTPLIAMLIFADLIPEIKHDHFFGHPIPPTIDKDLIKD
jgi:hypothetical protein